MKTSRTSYRIRGLGNWVLSLDGLRFGCWICLFLFHNFNLFWLFFIVLWLLSFDRWLICCLFVAVLLLLNLCFVFWWDIFCLYHYYCLFRFFNCFFNLVFFFLFLSLRGLFNLWFRCYGFKLIINLHLLLHLWLDDCNICIFLLLLLLLLILSLRYAFLCFWNLSLKRNILCWSFFILFAFLNPPFRNIFCFFIFAFSLHNFLFLLNDFLNL